MPRLRTDGYGNLFAHVDPSEKSYSIKDYLTVYLPSILHFYLLIYDFLSQQY